VGRRGSARAISRHSSRRSSASRRDEAIFESVALETFENLNAELSTPVRPALQSSGDEDESETEVPHYRRVGDVPRKRHIVHRGREGRLSEELVSQNGFAAASSLLYHRHSPSALLAARNVSVEREAPEGNSVLEPMHLRLPDMQTGDDPVLGRKVVAANEDLAICWVHARTSSPLYRNAAGDEIVFVHSGTAILESVFGTLEVGTRDYVVVPASTIHRWSVGEGEEPTLLVVEVSGHAEIPSRYLTPGGQMREGAPYSERDIRAPEDPLVVEGKEEEVLVRHRWGWACHVHQEHPFDVVGWDGCVYPFAFSIRDFEPVVGRLHQPPPVHQTFAGRAFVLCSFVPRPLDFDPQAVPIPYHHSNVDSDEVLFYVDGDFSSRHGTAIESGSLTLHPAGFAHGPQPGSVEAALGKARTDETAVMVDTFSPLGTTASARAVAERSYLSSWLS
jgi:homogentisate 1,2-dioxygenase